MCGPPASGKRTLCEGIAQRLGLEHVSASDLVNGMMMTDTDLGAKMREMDGEGLSISDELVEKLVTERLRERDCASKASRALRPSTFETLILLIFEKSVHCVAFPALPRGYSSRG